MEKESKITARTRSAKRGATTTAKCTQIEAAIKNNINKQRQKIKAKIKVKGLSHTHTHSLALAYTHKHTFTLRPDEKNRSKTINVLDENVFFIPFYFAGIEKS